MNGRVHLYEGYSSAKCAFPVRVMKQLGIKTLIVTNASGAINESLKLGDIIIIKDHISMPGLCGFNPLVGCSDKRFGERFFSMKNAYDKDIIKLIKTNAANLKLNNILKEGVYCMASGPNYETFSEAKLLRKLDVDVVGKL